MSKSIKLANDTYWSMDSAGVVLWSSSIYQGQTKTIPNLSKYKYIQIFYGRGNDYGQNSVFCLNDGNYKHAQIPILYANNSNNSFGRRIAMVYWENTNETFEYRGTISESFSTDNTYTVKFSNDSTVTYDRIFRIIGYN